MATLKTTPSDSNVIAYLQAIEDEGKRKDALQILEMMQRISDEKPMLWGGSMIGFGTYHYKYASGREGDWFLTGFSPRKQALTLYIMSGFSRYDDLMQQLGKFKTGKSCLYVKRLADIDLTILEQLIRESVDHMRTKKWNEC